MNGGGEFDGVNYSFRSIGVTVTLDGAGNDGSSSDNAVDASGARDNIADDVEFVIGSSDNDTLTGNNLANSSTDPEAATRSPEMAGTTCCPATSAAATSSATST